MKDTFFIVLLLGIAANPLHAVITSDEVGSHVTIAGEPVFGINIDGVALLAGEPFGGAHTMDDLILPFCTAALIADRYILSAAHCFDDDRDGAVDVRFDFPHVAAFELPDRTVLLDIRSGEGELPSIHFPDAWPEIEVDLAVIELAEDAPADIPRYSLYGGMDEVGRRFVLAGYGLPGHGSTGHDDNIDDRPQNEPD